MFDRSSMRAGALAFLLPLVPALTPFHHAEESDAKPTSRSVPTVRTVELTEPLGSRGCLGGVCVDRLGFAYVSNFRDSVWKVSPGGKVRLVTDSLYGSSGNAIDSRGDLLQANFFANTIVRIRRTGEIEDVVTEGLEGPVGIAVDAEDNLYVCNCKGGSIVRVTGSETSVLASGPRFKCPNGITFGDGDDLFVTNFFSDDVLRVRPDGTTDVFATVGNSGGNAHIAFAGGNLYVTDIRINRIFRISPAGEVRAVAGTGKPGQDDGPAARATLARPNGIAAFVEDDTVRLYFNTLVGAWRKDEPSRISLRVLELPAGRSR